MSIFANSDFLRGILFIFSRSLPFLIFFFLMYYNYFRKETIEYYIEERAFNFVMLHKMYGKERKYMRFYDCYNITEKKIERISLPEYWGEHTIFNKIEKGDTILKNKNTNILKIYNRSKKRDFTYIVNREENVEITSEKVLNDIKKLFYY